MSVGRARHGDQVNDGPAGDRARASDRAGLDGEPDLHWQVSVGLRKSDQAMVDAVNGVLDQLIAEGKLTAVYQTYGVEHRVP